MTRIFLSFLVALASASPAAGLPTAKITAEAKAYAGSTVMLDGTGSAAGEGVAYQWKVTSKAAGSIEVKDGGTLQASFVPPVWGAYDISLTASRGGEKGEAKSAMKSLNHPDRDDSPVFEGAKKVLYKTAPDALGGHAKLYLHVFDPAGWKASDKRGVVLIFHGGGWNRGNPKTYVPDAEYWASRGLVGITGQYRLGDREGTSPAACVADAKSAVRYLRAHAEELGIDPNKIAVGGVSAGAHIAACTGTVPGHNDPQDDAAVSCVPDAMLLYYPFQMANTRNSDMAPLSFVNEKTPPTLFAAGEIDGLAPAERGILWGEKMRGSPNEFRLFIYRNTHHPSGGKHDIIEPGADNDIIRQSDLFLAKLGYLTGEPTVAPMTAEAIEAIHIDPKTYKPLK